MRSLYFFVFFSMILTTSSFAASVDALLKPYGKQVGFSVRQLLDAKETQEVNGRVLFRPASIAKLVSTACSLNTLGHEYNFETFFGYRGLLTSAGDLKGDLVIRGAGDPSYVIEDLKEDLEKIVGIYGIKSIQGNIVFDLSYFGVQKMPISNEFDGDDGRSFTADLTTAPLNMNSFSFWVRASSPKPTVTVFPLQYPELKITNTVGFGANGVQVDYRPREGRAIVSGSISKGSDPIGVYRALDDPYESFARLTHRVMRELGVKWAVPQIKFEPKVAAEKLWAHRSRPLARILLDINKLSTNFGAELVLLAAAAKQEGWPSSPAKAKKVLDDCIQGSGVNLAAMALENASGLSRKSQLSASALSLFLAKEHDETVWPEYMTSLSVLGKDGTTRRRLPELAGRARLKTGSIQGVKSIAGYLFPKSGSPLSFALIFNCPTCEIAQMNETENRIISSLLESAVP